MEIVNEIKQKDDKEKKNFVQRSLADVQRVRLEKLMKNPVSLKTIPKQTFLYIKNLLSSG